MWCMYLLFPALGNRQSAIVVFNTLYSVVVQALFGLQLEAVAGMVQATCTSGKLSKIRVYLLP